MHLAEVLPVLQAQRGVDEIQSVGLLVGQVPSELPDELVDDVTEGPWRLAGLDGGVDRLEQRIDDRVLLLQRVHQRQLVGVAGHRCPQRRPQRVVFDLVVDHQELLELLPSQRRSQAREVAVPAAPRSEPPARGHGAGRHEW